MKKVTKRGLSSTVVLILGLLVGSALAPVRAQIGPGNTPLLNTPFPHVPNRTLPPIQRHLPPLAQCTPPTGPGTPHSSVAAGTPPQTWTAAASPHIVPFSIGIAAAVTIEPCAVVRIAPGSTISVNPGGAFVAAGTPGASVVIESNVPGVAWASINIGGGALSLTHAIVRGGGAPQGVNITAAGELRMLQTTGPAGVLHVDNVEIIGSVSQGVYIEGGVGFDASSQNLYVSGSASYPLHVSAPVMGSIPSGAYSRNSFAVIAISGTSSGVVTNAQTLHNRGVAYHVGSGQLGEQLDVSTQNGGPPAVLTIEPGVMIQFAPGGALNVNNSGFGGALVAIGGAGPQQQIVFMSDRGAAAAPGDWMGIYFNNSIDPQSVMQNVRVLYAGGASPASGNSCPYATDPGVHVAAIRIFAVPTKQFITNSEIIASGKYGIDRGWRDNFQPDFLATNTFIAVPACKQTTPRDSAGGCQSVLCP